ncbi:hypothetical protein QN289_03695 [Latilactobacillus curvatus]|uniref:hypothetical protein n=1 Tax=Latilactobacillus curvatus TaxID=28038 RepID=UPI0024DFC0AE|nr:hypothetical protein [Latilactobacillus curvatus]WIE01471.1 hypothetical protein QN289_03695 [Latilactobacillus curvatus]
MTINLNELYTAKEASLMLGKGAGYIKVLHHKTPEKMPRGQYRKIGRELIITKKGIEQLRHNIKRASE